MKCLWDKSQIRQFVKQAKEPFGKEGWDLFTDKIKSMAIESRALIVLCQSGRNHGYTAEEMHGLRFAMLKEAGLID